MPGRPPAALLLVLVALAAPGCGGEQPDASEAGAFDAARALQDVERQVQIGPRPSGSPGARAELRLVRRSLAAAGVRDVLVQRPYRNVVARLPGRGPGTVVVGAHYDTKAGIPGFVGANDGASGVAVLLGLARALERPLPGPSVDLVFFDAEEARGERPFERDGARGSRQFVEYARRGGEQGSPPLDETRAMVLFDLVGDCDLQIPRETSSSRRLYRLFADAARAAHPEQGSVPFAGEGPPVLDDHTPFLDAGIRAVDLIDFTFGPGPSPGGFWHTAQDTLDKVCADSLDAVGEAALEAIPRIR